MRLGVYGGSFDPVHWGHLLLAETARAEMKLDRVEFVPLGVPPHMKTVRTSSEDRFAMLERALAPYPEFGINRCEIDSPEISYTYKTLQYFRETRPGDELFLILSSETFNDLPNWVEPGLICERASLIVAQRAGCPEANFEGARGFASEERLDEFRSQVVSMPQIEISSSVVRERIATGRSVRFLVPDAVLDYIEARGLYRQRKESAR
ncbi:MAG: nicotinate-nucleotide adenylyltransferase [Thermoguttaceae bacterium]|nr:nicotinate-nucleotide adenylyltransferase [Thermoguttaceae bacterium]